MITKVTEINKGKGNEYKSEGYASNSEINERVSKRN